MHLTQKIFKKRKNKWKIKIIKQSKFNKIRIIKFVIYSLIIILSNKDYNNLKLKFLFNNIIPLRILVIITMITGIIIVIFISTWIIISIMIIMIITMAV